MGCLLCIAGAMFWDGFVPEQMKQMCARCLYLFVFFFLKNTFKPGQGIINNLICVCRTGI